MARKEQFDYLSVLSGIIGDLDLQNNKLRNIDQERFTPSGNDFWVISDGSGGSNSSPYTIRFNEPRSLRYWSETASTLLELNHDGSVKFPGGDVNVGGNQVSTGGQHLYVQSSQPSSPDTNDIWFDTS